MVIRNTSAEQSLQPDKTSSRFVLIVSLFHAQTAPSTSTRTFLQVNSTLDTPKLAGKQDD